MTKSKRKKGSWYYRMSLSQKRGMWGFIFLLPWMTGFLLFFLGPLIESVRYSFSDVDVQLGVIETTWLGIDNYVHALTVDPHFNQFMLTLAFPALAIVAIVVIFSLLAAMLINGNYPGRSVARTIFFIPIIIGAQLALQEMIGGDVVTEAIASDINFGGFGGGIFLETLRATGLPAELTGFVDRAIEGIFEVLSQSGVPVLIFLAGLQAIPPSLYEVAHIEGSTRYEAFWKVTLPMISPMVLLSTVYTIIELFSRHSRLINLEYQTFLWYIDAIGFTQGNYGVASAMVNMYVLASVVIIGIVTLLMSRKVFYYD